MRHYIINYIDNGEKKTEEYTSLAEAMESFNILDKAGKMVALYNLI